MFRDIQIVLDPPPNGVFTFEDIITGKVLFESNRDEKLDCCKVYFHCWVSTHVVKSTGSQNSQVNSVNYKDKDVVFGTSKKIYISNGETLQKKTRYEWPFQFDFRSEVNDAASLPPSGKYGNGNIEYKIVATPLTLAQAAQGENIFNALMNPNDRLFQKDSPISLTGLFMAGAKHLGGAAEQELPFVKIRSCDSVNGSLMAFQSEHEIAVSLVPQLAPFFDSAPSGHRLFSKSPHIPFEMDLQIPRQIIEGAYFPLLLNVSWPDRVENPPPATLVALNIHLVSLTAERASQQEEIHDRKTLLLDAKGLNIPLGDRAADLGQIFPIRAAGPAIVPSFDTRLMARSYVLAVEAKIVIAGKDFHVKFPDVRNFELVSQHVAIGRARAPPDSTPSAPKEKPVFQLKHSYIGRIFQDSNDIIKEASVLEAALALSRSLTKYEVPHEFPGGSLVKILPYKFDIHRTNTSNFDKVTDDQKIRTCFAEEGDLRIIEPESWAPEERRQLKLRYNGDQNLTILFPTTMMWNDDHQKKWSKETRNPVDAIKLDAVSLFNYRLSCAVTHRELNESQLGDFEGLRLSFNKDLHHHRKHIDINAARIAVEKYPQILTVLEDIGVDLESGTTKGQQRMPAPIIDQRQPLQPGYEEDLVKSTKKHSLFHRKQ